MADNMTIDQLKVLTYNSAGAMEDNDNTETGYWSGGEEITVGKLNRIDNGISNATEGVRVLAERVSGMDTSGITGLNERVGTVETQIELAKGNNYNTLAAHMVALDTAVNTIPTAVNNAVATAVDNNNTISGLSTNVSDLLTRISNVETTQASHTTSIGHYNTTENEVLVAHSSLTLNTDYASLGERFEAIEGSLNTSSGGLGNRITALETEIDINNSNGSRIDQLEANVATKASTTDLNTLSNIVNDATTGLAATKAIADAAVTSEELTSALSNKASTDITDALDTRLDAIDGGSAIATTNGTLAARVTALESNPTSATVVIGKSSITYNNDGIPTNIGQVASADKDYLLQGTDNKYYYWKYINGSWNLISGGSGDSNNEINGTSSHVLSQAEYTSITKEENVDYYVIDANNIYHHYRYIPDIDNVGQLKEIELGINPNNIKRYNITTSYDQATEKTYLDFYEFNYGVQNSIDTSTMTPIQHLELPSGGSSGGTTTNVLTRAERITPQNVVTILSNNKIYLRFFYSAVDAQDTSETYNGRYTLKYNTSRVLDTNTIQSGIWSTVVDGWQESTIGYYEFDITDYCSLGTQTFDLNIEVLNGQNVVANIYRQWSVRIVQLKLESESPDIIVTPTNKSYSLSYIPYGALTKTLHVLIDGNELSETPTINASSSGAHLTYTIPAQTEGTHKIEFYLTAMLNGKQEPTDHIYKDSIWYNTESSNNPIMIASTYRGRSHNIVEYDDISIPYTVYNKNNNTFDVEYYLDYGTANQQLIDTVNGTSGVAATFNYNFIVYGNHTLSIKVDSEVLTINFAVEALAIDVAQVNNAVIDFNPALLSNTSRNRLPTWTDEDNNKTYSLSVSPNFNWADNPSGGGYHTDKDGKCFIVKAGTYAEIDYKMFTKKIVGGQPASRVFTDGAEMKIIFKVADVRNADAIWFTNMAPIADEMANVGIQLNAHNGSLKTSAANVSTINFVETTTTTVEVTENDEITKTTTTSQTSGVRQTYSYTRNDEGTTTNGNIKTKVEWDEDELKFTITTTTTEDNIKTEVEVVTIETPTAATDTYLYFPYSEEDKIELDININPQGNNEDFIMSYEDGVASKAYCYTVSEQLYQKENEEAVIRIGSNDCDVYIYGIKIYKRALSSNDILRNFIADGATVSEKVKRYNRNSIYYNIETDTFSPYYQAGVNKLDPLKIAEKMPDVKILMLEAPYFTNSKKDFIKDSKLRCIQAPGGTLYPADIINSNWLFENGYHSGQGTTSDNYGQSARNIDFLFECDGTHKPSDKVDAISGYVSQITKGYETVQQQAVETCSDWKGNDCKVPLTPTSIPNNFFNLKVNVASSENVNNALLQKRYNDFLPYISPAKKRDSRIKNDMEFVPAILFLKESDTTLANHREFNDTEWHFYALGNLGDSKKTDYTRAYDPNDMNEFTLEISDNNTNNSQFQSGVYNENETRIVETSDSTINSMGYLYPISNNEWNAVREPTQQETADGNAAQGGDKKKIDVRTAPNGKVYVNYRHRMLSSEPLDGDHSFELRYACKGDYRDGKVVNDTTGKAKAQLAINRGVWEAFYTWVVTSTEQQFINELEEWCVPEAVEFFYAFTHFYTMMDNRAKNTFWHFAKTGTHHKVSRPVPELLHIYDELIDGQYVHTSDSTVLAPTYYVKDYVLTADETFVEGTQYYTKNENYNDYDVFTSATVTIGDVIPANTYYVFNTYKLTTDNTVKEGIDYYTFMNDTYSLANTTSGTTIKYYYTQYAFDIWDYDNDTAIGIDNNGKLVFPYGKEDTDYRVEGDASSGYVFNGAGSIFWRRLSNNFTSDIADVFNRVNQNFCFDANNLIEQFDNYQNCYPEEIWRLDIQRKYIRTFTGLSYDNSITAGKQNTRFLREMMQGRKKYQRRQWVKDQEVYFGSKYMLSNILTDTIEMVCYTPSGTVAVQPNYNLVITPYQDMYVNVAVGNGNLRNPVRAKGGIPVTIDCTANMNETRIYVYGGSYIQALSNIAPMYIGANIFSNAKRLKTLDLGSNNPNYHNANLTTLTLNPNMPLLETLNIKNCDNLGGIINLSESNNLRTIEAAGTYITGVTLPPYSSITTLHLPSSVNTIALDSAQRLDEFYMVKKINVNNNITFEQDYSGLFTVSIKDSDYSDNINWLSLLSNELSHITSLQLLDLNKSSINNINELEPFAIRKNELGNYVDEDTGISYSFVNLSGTVAVTGDWSEIEKASYENLWNNQLTLVIDQNAHKVTKYKITYKDSITNETLYELYVSEPFYFVDIWTDGLLTTIPTKPSTVSSKYIFGQMSQGTYTQYSGWTPENEDTSIYDQIKNQPAMTRYYEVPADGLTVYTTFTEQPQTYTVRWLLKNGDTTEIAKEENVPYGGGYNLIAPTVKEIRQTRNTYTWSMSGNNCTYSIFKGWQKAPINIRPTTVSSTYDIYGEWLERTNVPYTEVLSSNSYDIAEKLLVSSKLGVSLQSSVLPEGLRYQIQMGYNGPTANRVDLLELANKSKYQTGGPISTINNYYPFAAGQSFTIMLDYKFDTIYNNQINEAVLFSCYKNESGSIQGLKLYYNPQEKNIASSKNPKAYISFGDTNVTNKKVYAVNQDAEIRNTIVLRHIAGENVLYIYTGTGENGLVSEYNITKFRHSLQYDGGANSSSAQMILGGISNAPSTTRNASGIFYGAYYWPEDLGESECLQLAKWCHEKTTFILEDYKNKIPHSVGTNMSTNGLVLHTLTSSEMGNIDTPTIPSEAPATINWASSTVKDFYNSRIFESFPILLQSIVALAAVDYRSAQIGETYGITDGGLTDNNYVFAPALTEVTGETDTHYSSEAQGPFYWYSASEVKVKKWQDNSFIEGKSEASYTNLRFPTIATSFNQTTNTIYYQYPATGTRADEAIGNSLTEGDILILASGGTYIYASASSVLQGAPIVIPEETTDVLWCNEGGWIPAKNWLTRSVYHNILAPTTKTKSYLKYVNNTTGEVVTPPDKVNEGFGIVYSIAI